MAMNWVHGKLCGSALWERYTTDQLVPEALAGVDLGDRALEIGPGYGANIKALQARTSALTTVEISEDLAIRLRERYGDSVDVVHGDGTALPFADNDFSSVLTFTMLHHVPSPTLQDELFAQAYRVLRPGGVLAGSDSIDSKGFRLIHFRDTCVPVPPSTLPVRLRQAGFEDVVVETSLHSVRFRAVKA